MLCKSYGHQDRYYHHLQHVLDCLKVFSSFRFLAERPAEIKLALWFHDIVYDSQRQDNEVRSVLLLRDVLTRVNVAIDIVQRIETMIMATKSHACTDGDISLLLDVDLSILGMSPFKFQRYDRAIRLEYAWLADHPYAVARLHVLQTFLNRPSIYQNLAVRHCFEQQARQNIQDKIQSLKEQVADNVSC